MKFQPRTPYETLAGAYKRVSRERKMILGGLTPAQVKQLSPEVRAARAAYISDSYVEMDGLRENGVRELRGDHPDKDDWLGRHRSISNGESLDLLLEHGYQVDAEGNVYEPDTRTRRNL